MVRRDAAELAAGAASGGLRLPARWLLLGVVIASAVVLAETLMHGGPILTVGLGAIALLLGVVTALVMQQELESVRTFASSRSVAAPTRDRVTIGGMVLWIGGTLVAALSAVDDPARGLASAVALGGLSGWAGGPARTSIRRRLAGQRGPLASLPSIVVLVAGTAAAVLTFVAALVIWASA